MIEPILPGSKTRMRILENIYYSKEINLSELIKKSKTSPNIVLGYANKLVEFGVIREKRMGGVKKTHLRLLAPKFDSENARLLFSVVENNKKLIFFKKYTRIGKVLENLKNIKNIKFALVFGSYARFAPSEDSDLDIIIVGNLNKKDINDIRENFIALEAEPSIKVETIKKLKSNIKKPLYQNILAEHVIVAGIGNFMTFLDDMIK